MQLFSKLPDTYQNTLNIYKNVQVAIHPLPKICKEIRLHKKLCNTVLRIEKIFLEEKN